MLVNRFKGLNNVSDSLGLGLEWLAQADNVNITDRGKLEGRGGYSLALAGAFSSGYATLDESRMYVTVGSTLKAMAGDASAVTLASGLSAATMYWTEINGQVFYNNGTDSGIIEMDNSVLPWAWTVPTAPALAAVTGTLPAGLYQVRCAFVLPDGRMTGASESAELVIEDGQALQISAIPQVAGYSTRVFIAPANSSVYGLAGVPTGTAMVWNSRPDDLGYELATAGLNPLPAGCDVIQAWRGRIFAAQHFPELDQSAVWSSKPLSFHLFDLKSDVFLVPGRVLMLAPHDGALIVGTNKEIRAYTGEKLVSLAPYGVVPGRHWSEDDPAGDDGSKRILFWTTRGVCQALPFSNLTERQVSVAPGVSAGGAIVRSGGQKRFVAVLQQGGSAFNQR